MVAFDKADLLYIRVIHRVIDLHAFVDRANGSGFNCTDIKI